jgi:Fe2+ transport system protein FeoA
MPDNNLRRTLIETKSQQEMALPNLKTISLESSPRCVSSRVVSVDDTSEWAVHLRRIGFHEGVEVEVLSGRDPVMVRCQNGCVALRRCMLGCVQVCAMQEAQQRLAR